MGQQVYKLPASAVDSLSDPALKLVLHNITFSHYCERARWTLRLLGIPYEEVNYLPLQHMPALLQLQRAFKQPPGPPTASSKSPAATPCLAIYDSNNQPLCLLQDSALICRYAVLRASALGLPPAKDLYGPGLTTQPQATTTTEAAAETAHPAATADPTTQPQQQPTASEPAATASTDDRAAVGASGGGVVVSGGCEKVVELERRLGGTLGIEVRRIAYFHLLPLSTVGAALFTNNSANKLLARGIYWMCRLLLPYLLKINAATAARGKERLLAEFNYLDGLLQQQQQQQQNGTSDTGSAPGRLPFYLLGPNMSIADIQVACLAAPLLCIPADQATTWMPPLDDLPPDLKALSEELRQRPTGRFVLDMWRVHGPNAAAGAS